ncbi:Glycosyl hydrolases family 2 [Pedobacter westerhofensis]|uniref:beta-galactosidase n=1 Tax=Pedobacter westerhofensis TaxID=425512 RepID=A0A521FC90_9SPHI|nr:sugar-binding domain-containing protein [Pedobacter westerhofensis]SMO93817.1 Glycosyl hydrolases family 2 [Pedobacter westerhofensis]
MEGEVGRLKKDAVNIAATDMNKINRLFFTGLLMMLLHGGMAGAQTISLAGKWRFQTDAADEGITRKWYSVPLSDEITLPGSMAENLKGDDITLQTKWTGSIYDSSYYFNPRLAKYRQPGNIKIPFWLTPAKHYVGAAWYQREVIIPAGWKGKRIVLELEYAHSETTVWVDQKEAGSQYTFVTAQKYDLSSILKPGRHVITIRIDNRIKAINVGQDSHSLTDHTQGNWNGIVGKIQLTAGPAIVFDDIQVYPDLKNKTARVSVLLKGPDCSGRIRLNAHSFNSGVSQQVPAVSADFEIRNGSGKLEINLPMGDKMQTWDEFDPVLYQLTAVLTTGKAKRAENVQKELSFGMREFKAAGRQFEINGRPVFLRGTVNNCEFPLTGYPAMDEAAWARIFKIAKAHGLNHMRFHSWCPPEAAFIAADKAGFYLQPEGPSWANHGTSIGDNKPIDQFIYDETNRMEKAYGNYASYCMLAYGNEPRGKQVEYLSKFNDYWKNKDSRRLYTGASVGGSWPVIPNNEYMVRGGARGLSWNDRPETIGDYSALIAKFTVPFVAHEMGQYCVFPDFKEIKKYTGVYRAKNFELFEEDLKDHDMADEAERFLMASGKLQALAYKNEIEKALRTPGYSGYQLLSLNDYPGQGTALVGVLNAFWDEKGYISPAEFRRFSNSTVLLARIPKFVYQNDESFAAALEVAHYGKSALQQAVVSWKITNASSRVLASGDFDPKDIPLGNCFSLGKISFALLSVKSAAQLHLEVNIKGTEFANGWDFWVYPAKLPAVKTDIYYCTALDKKAEEILGKGGKVFLDASGKVVKGKEVVQTFQPVFWNTSWFKMRPPHTLGILVEPKAAAFANFPTSFHSDMQWWEIVNNSQVMNLEDFPAGFRPLVQSVDTWFLNRKLAIVYEAKVGEGKLMVSSASLAAEKGPAARQLFYSLQKYMKSDAFDPQFQVDLSVVKDVFLTGSKIVFKTYTRDSPDELKPKPAKP